MYCGSNGKLEDEHVLPYGLCGNRAILPASSCRACAAITGATEAKVLRGNFRGLRERFSLPSRSKERPRKLPLFCVNDDESAKVMVDVEHYPVTLILPVFSGPRIASFPEMLGRDGLPWGQTIGWDFGVLNSKYGIESFASNSIDGWSFARMLAKIAHSDAAARIGLENFEPLLTDLILRDDIEPSTLIGTFAKIEEPVGDHFTHQISCHEITAAGVRYLVSKIRLFSDLGAPTYLVTAGVLDLAWEPPQLGV